MTDPATLSRPYAKAIFQVAQDSNELHNWSEYLRLLVTVVTDPRTINLIDSPLVTTNEKAAFIISIISVQITEEVKEFVKLLANNKKLLILPNIASLYEQYRAIAEQTMKVTVYSAIELGPQQQQQIKTIIEKHFNKTVSINWQQNPLLLGGCVIKTGDTVLDCSVRGQLHTLQKELIAN